MNQFLAAFNQSSKSDEPASLIITRKLKSSSLLSSSASISLLHLQKYNSVFEQLLDQSIIKSLSESAIKQAFVIIKLSLTNSAATLLAKLNVTEPG